MFKTNCRTSEIHFKWKFGLLNAEMKTLSAKIKQHKSRSVPAHLESFDRCLFKSIISALQVFQVGRETGFLIGWSLPTHCYTYFTFRGDGSTQDQSLILNIHLQSKSCENLFFLLTTFMSATTLILAEMVALSFTAWIWGQKQTKVWFLTIRAKETFSVKTQHERWVLKLKLRC